MPRISKAMQFDIGYIESYFKTFPDKIPLRCWCDVLIQQQDAFGIYLLNIVKKLKQGGDLLHMKNNEVDATLQESAPKQVSISLPDSNIVALGPKGNKLENLLKENRFILVFDTAASNSGYIIVPNQLRYFKVYEFGSNCMYLEIIKVKEISLKEMLSDYNQWYYKKLITLMATY